jgi:hypothetical protein
MSAPPSRIKAMKPETEALINDVARGIAEANRDDPIDDSWNLYVPDATAALLVALPRWTEEMAKAASNAGAKPVGGGDGGTYITGTAIDAANAIRHRLTDIEAELRSEKP